MLNSLAVAAESRIMASLHPRTRSSYLAGFRLFLAFFTYINIQVASTVETIIVYLKFLAQNNLKAVSIHNHLSILKYYFSLFGWSTDVSNATKVSTDQCQASSEGQRNLYFGIITKID